MHEAGKERCLLWRRPGRLLVAFTTKHERRTTAYTGRGGEQHERGLRVAGSKPEAIPGRKRNTQNMFCDDVAQVEYDHAKTASLQEKIRCLERLIEA